VKKDIVVSLCDYTGIMVNPWLDAGYTCILVDPQHPEGITRNGNLIKIGAKVEDCLDILSEVILSGRVKIVFGFPVCTDLAVSGAAHFNNKLLKDKHFQTKAMQLVHECRMIGELSGSPWFIENPISAISSAWRKPDHYFHPFEYGGYLPEGDEHPEYPEYIAPQDAYPKRTCLWVGNKFVMPEKKVVYCKPGYSDQYNKMGGKSSKTKNIRSATPRGFAKAVFEANK
jgi:hypothetical protein